MGNPWFRMYSEFSSDPKVQMLSETDQRRYVMLLCLRCSNGNETLHDEQIAFQLRISDEDWLTTKALLLSKCLINELSKPTAWDKRQFVSDSSTPRVSKYREKVKRECNVTETAPDTDTDTDTDKKTTCANAQSFAEFWDKYPKRKNKGDALRAWKTLKPSAELLALILRAVEVATRSDDWRKEGGKFIPYPATWIRAMGWEDQPTVTIQPVRRVAA